MNYSQIVQFLAAQFGKSQRLTHLIQDVAREISPDRVLLLDYPLSSKQRWNMDHPHPELVSILNGNRDIYRAHLESFLSLSECFLTIPERKVEDSSPSAPSWINGWTPALDGIALYSFLVKNEPGHYLEVGSGNSTKFARKAIADHHLKTKITSIDPQPRAEVDAICDEVIRAPVENVERKIFDRLQANDILYIDNSHRVFMNSDATVLFLDVLPRLAPGVLVEIHDVTLPYDYPENWVNRYYSEQYLLASYLLARSSWLEIVLPNYFISHDDELRRALSPLWEKQEMKNVPLHGCSFWLRIRQS